MIEEITYMFEQVVQLSILILEGIGLFVLMASAFKSAYLYLKKDNEIRLKLAQGIALALEFKMGSEVLRTVIIRKESELIILGSIIALRAALTFLIHWEIKNESKAKGDA